MEIISNVEHKDNLLYRFLLLVLIGGVGFFGAWLFLYITTGQYNNPEIAHSFPGTPEGGITMIPLAVAFGVMAACLIIQDRKKEVKRLIFDDEAKTLQVEYKPFWGNALRQHTIGYDRLFFRYKFEEKLGSGGEKKEYLIIHDRMKAVCRFDPTHAYWKKYKHAYKRLKTKLEQIVKSG